MKTYTKTNFRKLVAAISGMSLLLALIVLPVGSALAAQHTDTTAVSIIMTSGSLAVTAAGATSLTGGNVVSPSGSTATGTMSGFNYIDGTGTNNGWTASGTTTHLTIVVPPVKISGANDTATSSTSSLYDGTMGELAATGGGSCIYTVTVDTGGAVTTMTYDVTLSAGCTDPGTLQTAWPSTATDNMVGNTGVLVDFAAATYVNGDSWDILVDVMDYTSLTATPASPTANVGVLTGLTAGSAGVFVDPGLSATSNSFTILTAAAPNGNGDYDQDVALSQAVHGYTQVGTYSSVFTISIV